MPTPARSIAFVGFLGLAAGGWWIARSTETGVVVSEEDRDQAREDGSGAAAVAIGAAATGVLGEGFHPTTLAEAKAILDREALERAHERVAAALVEAPDDGALHVIRSELARRLRLMPETLESGRRGAELLATNAEAHYTYARALGVELMRLASSGPMGLLGARKKIPPYKLALETATDLDPGHWEALKERILFLAFTPSFAGGDVDLARELLPALDASAPLYGTLTRARLMKVDGDVEGALALCRRAAEEHPDSQEPPWVEAGLLVDMQKLDEAEPAAVQAADAALARALEGPREEAYYQALYQRAVLRTETGFGADEVLTFMDEYIAAQPGWEWAPSVAKAHMQRGLALLALERVDEARSALEAALALDGELAEASEALERL